MFHCFTVALLNSSVPDKNALYAFLLEMLRLSHTTAHTYTQKTLNIMKNRPKTWSNYNTNAVNLKGISQRNNQKNNPKNNQKKTTKKQPKEPKKHTNAPTKQPKEQHPLHSSGPPGAMEAFLVTWRAGMRSGSSRRSEKTKA